MHFSKLLPLAALASFAVAQGGQEQDVVLDVKAYFLTDNGTVFPIDKFDCVNFTKKQPTFDDIAVFAPNVCSVYSDANCKGTTVGTFTAGVTRIVDLKFRSVECHEGKK
ncbi:hypothetical protein V490_09148 [Pseudogymnoascus sp. VKM F-3557]|nr:hypothetical protein V490_09148 [Pseudogymnoascus sp. VKM F-3557]